MRQNLLGARSFTYKNDEETLLMTSKNMYITTAIKYNYINIALDFKAFLNLSDKFSI